MKGEEKGQQKGRRRRTTILGGRRVTGTIVTWKNTMGWINPSASISHPEAELHQGKVFLHASDLAAGAKHDSVKLRGARVNFTVYADGTGLGAQQCRVVTLGDSPVLESDGQVQPVKKTIVKRSPLGKFAVRSLSNRMSGQVLDRRPQQQEPWVKGGLGALRPLGKGLKGARGSKGKGKGKGKRRGPKEQPPRRRIGGRREGKVLRWKRTFGWIELLEPIKHKSASKHNGEVFCHQVDVLGGKTPRLGDTVDFLPYADRTGLGAEKCRVLERADGNDEGEEVEELDELEEAEAAAAADAGKDDEEAVEEEEGEEEEEAEPPDDEPPAEEAEEDPSRSKAKGKGKADANGKATGKGKASSSLGVQRTIDKRLAGSSFSCGSRAQAGQKGSSAGKGSKSLAFVMESKPKAGSKPGVNGKVGKAGKGAKGSGKMASPPSTPPTGKESGLPPNWEEHWSEEHGVPYFWNRATKESRW
eukprot:CAMPEP_0171058052 /NCGR_PEP_ID=MMETSP0766_2-20121228/2227_1 /TAXON_ID=439317 /ORGANISM="Gambierdiscus australes, Strain CAWD 149" /LENGTH=472 /DNA_ID=CAMNT_0011513267 /DNA_START=119 /DNA_END=1534 /DNA_ORIENTATION=+